MSSILHGKSTSIPIAPTLERKAAVVSGGVNKRIMALEREKAGEQGFKRVVKEIDLRRRDVGLHSDPTEGQEGPFTGNPLQSWMLPEGATVREKRCTLASPNSHVGVVGNQQAGDDRILLSEQGQGMEARIRLATGSVAGMEVQLRSGVNGIDASILRQPDSSRISAASVIQEMAIRLRSKGLMVHLAEGASRRKEQKEEEDNSSSGQ